MKKFMAAMVFGLLLASAGFAAAAIGSHGKLLHMLTGTRSTPYVITPASTTPGGRQVTICHITHRWFWKHGRHGRRWKVWKRYGHSIIVSQNSVAGHLRHGDHLGSCITITLPPKPTAPATTTTTSSFQHGDSDDDDQGSNGHGHHNGLGNFGANLFGSQGQSGHGHGRGHRH